MRAVEGKLPQVRDEADSGVHTLGNYNFAINLESPTLLEINA